VLRNGCRFLLLGLLLKTRTLGHHSTP
jgi:hypothetical protein